MHVVSTLHAAAVEMAVEIEHGIHVAENFVVPLLVIKVSVKVVQEIFYVEETSRVLGVVLKVGSEVAFVVAFDRFPAAGAASVEYVVLELLEQLGKVKVEVLRSSASSEIKVAAFGATASMLRVHVALGSVVIALLVLV